MGTLIVFVPVPLFSRGAGCHVISKPADSFSSVSVVYLHHACLRKDRLDWAPD